MAISELVYGLVCRFMEPPLDPLTGRQAMSLDSVRIEGLKAYPDSKSIRDRKHPSAVYFFFQGDYIGTAYGSRFVRSNDDSTIARHATVLPDIINRIESSYLNKQEAGIDG